MPRMLGRLGVRPHEREDHVRRLRARGPDLLAVDHEVVAVARRARLNRGQVRPGSRLGVALAPLGFATHHGRQMLLLLLLGTVHEDRRPDVGHALDRRAHLREYLTQDELLDRRHLAAAVLLRPGGGDPPLVEDRLPPRLHLRDPRLTERAAVHAAEGLRVELVLREIGRQVLLDERAHLGAPCGLLRCIGEVDHRVPPGCGQRSKAL